MEHQETHYTETSLPLEPFRKYQKTVRLCTYVLSKGAYFKKESITVVSLKSAHGWSTLQVCQRRGWVLFQLFPHLTTKEHPCHVYSDSKPSKQIIEHKTTYHEITSAFKVES